MYTDICARVPDININGCKLVRKRLTIIWCWCKNNVGL